MVRWRLLPCTSTNSPFAIFPTESVGRCATASGLPIPGLLGAANGQPEASSAKAFSLLGIIYTVLRTVQLPNSKVAPVRDLRLHWEAGMLRLKAAFLNRVGSVGPKLPFVELLILPCFVRNVSSSCTKQSAKSSFEHYSDAFAVTILDTG